VLQVLNPSGYLRPFADQRVNSVFVLSHVPQTRGRGANQLESLWCFYYITPETCKALREWLDMRGTICLPNDKPLFVGLAGPQYGKRLSGKGVWVIITSLGDRLGIRAKPHGLRHASITAVLDASGDLRAGQRHARHASA